MPYKFRLKEPLEDGVRRIAREQLERAVAGFEEGASQDLAIHGARRRLKKVRALLRLIRPALGSKAYKHWNAELRNAGVLFSDARDVIVMGAVAQSLTAKSSARARQALTALQRSIDAAQEAAAPVAHNNAIHAGVERIRAAVLEADTLRCGDMRVSDLGEGAAIGLAQSQEAFAQAYGSEDDESFHEWRKTVQRHWRHMQLLDAAWPEFFGTRALLAQEIARLLGDDHDLAVLKTFTAEKIGAGITPKQAEILFGLVQGRQQKLRAKAKILGGALMAASPKGLARETEAYWDMALERWSERKALKVNGRATDEHDIGDALEGGADAAEEEIAEANRPDSPLIQ